jgi:adenine deaminase
MTSADAKRRRMRRQDALEVLQGRHSADLVLQGGRIVDVWSGTIRDGGVAITGDTIVRAGEVDALIGAGTEVVDVGGAYLTPGLIETHMHAYESQLSLTELARVLLPHGTTALPEAMYGAGQVCGLDAVRFFVEELERTPITVLLQVPVLGYLQNLELGLPGGPRSLSGADLAEVSGWEGCVGLEEPPYIPIAERDPVVEELLSRTLEAGQVVMGHGAGLQPDELSGYAAAGVTADHEAVSAEEALARIREGMMVSMRESCVARNQVELQKAITEHGADPSLFMFCADVLDPVEAASVGHIDQSIRLAVAGGVDPIDAVRMATLNAARYYRVDHRLGSLAPGRQADVLVVDDLESFAIRTVYAKGQRVVEERRVVADLRRPVYPAYLRDTVRLKEPAAGASFRVESSGDADTATVRVIGAELLVSDERHFSLPVRGGAVAADASQDVIKLAMLDRYARSDTAAIGFLQGYRLARGAIGTTYNPMYHNVLVAGVDDDDMATAANALAQMGGGFVAVDGGEVTAVPLPLCGLLSDAPADEFLPALERLYAKVRELGCTMEAPFHNLAFTAVCGELPFFKLSHEGLFDVVRRTVVPTLVEPAGAEAVRA